MTSRPRQRAVGVREQRAGWRQGGDTRYLLDVNVLIAMIDTLHPHHRIAHAWVQASVRQWATCPLTENGVVRIVGHKRYPHWPGSLARVAQMMELVRAIPGHVFWPDDISLMDATYVDTARLLDTSQVADTYLLALAVAHGGKLATLDKRLVADAVKGGQAALHLIE